jgi:hypothetical protein
VRDTTFNSPTYPNPSIDYSAGNSLSFWLRAESIAPAQRWIAHGGGNWDDPANWGTGVVPNASNAVANFLNDITGAATISVNNDIIVNTVRLKSPFAYTFVGPSILTFSAPAESSMNINVEQGSHTFAGPITLDSNSGTFGVMNFNVTAAADVLRITGDITVNNSVPLTVFKTGAGRVELKKLESPADPLTAPMNLRVTGGTLKLTAGGGRTRVNDLFIVGGNTPTAKLDITDNPFVIDYVAPNPSPLATIQAQIKAAYNGGGANAWTGQGITTSTGNAQQFAIGYGEASALATVPAVFGTVDSDTVLLRRTRYGDATLDGLVNLADFNKLASNFGLTGKFWTDGDFNYDGTVNLGDFNLLASNFGLSAAGPDVTPQDWANLAAAVPEPSLLLLSGVPAFAGMRRRRRHS